MSDYAGKPGDEDEKQVRPFAAALQDIASGTVHARLSDQLQQLVVAVTETGKKEGAGGRGSHAVVGVLPRLRRQPDA